MYQNDHLKFIVLKQFFLKPSRPISEEWHCHIMFWQLKMAVFKLSAMVCSLLITMLFTTYHIIQSTIRFQKKKKNICNHKIVCHIKFFEISATLNCGTLTTFDQILHDTKYHNCDHNLKP